MPHPLIRPHPSFVLLIAAAVGLTLLSRGREGDEADRLPATTTASVIRAVDGDTILVTIGGQRRYVRYIGVDTPESVKPDAPVECFGKRAHAFNQRLVGGRRVVLRFDRERTDRYGRLLAYVYAEERFVNAELVRRGYARTLTIRPNDRHAELLSRLEAKSGRLGRGLWSVC